MMPKPERNPVDVAFATGQQQRHQVHADRRPGRQRRVKHALRTEAEWDSD